MRTLGELRPPIHTPRVDSKPSPKKSLLILGQIIQTITQLCTSRYSRNKDRCLFVDMLVLFKIYLVNGIWETIQKAQIPWWRYGEGPLGHAGVVVFPKCWSSNHCPLFPEQKRNQPQVGHWVSLRFHLHRLISVSWLQLSEQPAHTVEETCSNTCQSCHRTGGCCLTEKL